MKFQMHDLSFCQEGVKIRIYFTKCCRQCFRLLTFTEKLTDLILCYGIDPFPQSKIYLCLHKQFNKLYMQWGSKSAKGDLIR